MNRAGWIPAILVAIGIWCSALPLGRLFEATPWRAPLALALVVLVVVGAAARLTRHGRILAPVAGFVAVVLVLHLSTGSPLLDLPRVWSAHVVDAVVTIRTSPPPAPATDGIAFTIAGAVALIAWLADLLGVTLRRPALAGLVISLPLLVTVANSGDPLPWLDVAAVAAPWLLLLAVTHARGVADASGRPAAEVAGEAAPTVLVVGIGVLAAALVLGTTLPRLPVRYLADGLGRGGASQVGFSPSPSMLQDLTSEDRTPVLRYTTDDPAPPPIRVSVATTYSGGRWLPDEVTTAPSSTPRLFAPRGLRRDVPRTPRSFDVSSTRLVAPYLGSPAPVVAGSVTGSDWAMDPRTGVLVVDRRPTSYSLRYAVVDPREAMVDGEYPPQDFSPQEMSRLVEELGLTSAVRPAVAEAAREATQGADSPYERAVAIQEWLRDPSRFTYSLTLPEPPAGMSQDALAETAVDRFLQDRVGYCVQFTTAMVLMARAEGIPARAATGFLPGTPSGDAREVLASDAHAWPELYFSGLGWIRFEPTPSVRSGAAPAYAAPAPTSAPTPTPTTAAPSTPATATGAAPERDREAELNRLDEAEGDAAAAERARTTWLWLIAALVLVLLLPAAAAWWIRRRRFAAARDSGGPALAEAYWQDLLGRLDDLDRAPPGALTPRAARAFLRQRCVLRPEADAALDRLATAVEESRYARVPTPVDESSLAADVRLVESDAAEFVPRARRLRSRLLPGVVSRACRSAWPARRF